jgi:hypothetical protein
MLIVSTGCGDAGTPEQDVPGSDQGIDTVMNDTTGDVSVDETRDDSNIDDTGIDQGVDADQELIETDVPVEIIDNPDTNGGCVDPDGDYFGINCPAGPDCAPSDPLRHATMMLYADADFDGHGTGTISEQCVGELVPPGWATNNNDCNDADPTVYPQAPEIPDDMKANGCTGADMTAATATGIYVVPGNPDTNEGTRESPVGTLTAGLAKAIDASVKNIFVATGTLNENVVIETDMAIHGGYDASTWAKTATKTRLNSATEIGIKIKSCAVLIDGFQVFGYANEGNTTPYADVVGIWAEDANATFHKCTITGGYLSAGLTDGRKLATTGIKVVSGNVVVMGSTVGSGTPDVSEWSGTGFIEREAVSNGILLESGTFKMLGGSIGFGANISLNNIHGTTIGVITTRGLLATGGQALLNGLDIDGGAETIVADNVEDVALAKAATETNAASVEVAGNAHVWVMNTVAGTGLLRALNEVTAGNGANAESDAMVRGDVFIATTGILEVFHCDLHADKNSEAASDASATAGTASVTDRLAVHLFRAEFGASLRIVNSAGYSSVVSLESAMITSVPEASVSMYNNVFWAEESGNCMVWNNIECVETSEGLNDCANIPGCAVSTGNSTANPMWNWWDTVQEGSPLRDSGVDPSTLGTNVTTDLRGFPRPQGAGYDIGAYEFAAE